MSISQKYKYFDRKRRGRNRRLSVPILSVLWPFLINAWIMTRLLLFDPPRRQLLKASPWYIVRGEWYDQKRPYFPGFFSCTLSLAGQKHPLRLCVNYHFHFGNISDNMDNSRLSDWRYQLLLHRWSWKLFCISFNFHRGGSYNISWNSFFA